MEKSVSAFFKEDAPVYGTYDNLRKIPNVIDGLKVSQRKILWTGFKKAKKDYLKTDVLANLVTLETCYLHGSASLCSVCDSLVQQFVGAANFAFFDGNSGGWGCRLIPESSAPRYTRLKLNDFAEALFNEADNEILEKQFFEGQYIEPKFFVPIFPVIFLNSTDGLSTGFSSKIYSRNPREIIEYIKKKISGTENPRMQLLPWFRNFKGTTRINPETNTAEVVGKIDRINTTTYKITELPVGTDYKKYVEYLDKMIDDGKITDYSDMCDPKTDEILFEVKTTRAWTNSHQKQDELNTAFKLVKNLPENLNCIDETGRIHEYANVKEILDAFIKFRLEFYGKRRKHLLEKLAEELTVLKSKFNWCKGIISGEIVVANKPKDEICAKLEKKFSEEIKKIDGNYNYLFNMGIASITKEKMVELKIAIVSKVEEYKKIKALTPESMWLEDLKILDAILKKKIG